MSSSNNKTIAIVVIVVLLAASVVGIVFLGPILFPSTPKVAIVFATGGLGDKSFNDGCFDGAEKARLEFGWNFDYVQPALISEYEGFLQDFAAHEGREDAYDLIISIGYDQAEALNTTALAYPNQYFALVDMVVFLPNITNLV
ncbi:MAG: BMP family lipoprotein, partial [Candidatus Thorarchaeota archaeon]